MIISKTFKWHCAHRLLGHKGLCSNLHGHTYKLVVYVEGDTKHHDKDPDNGMIVDYGDLKKIVENVIVDKYDHATIIWEKDTDLFKAIIEVMKTKFLLISETTTAENIVIDIWFKLLEEIKDESFVLSKIELWETETSCAMVEVRR